MMTTTTTMRITGASGGDGGSGEDGSWRRPSGPRPSIGGVSAVSVVSLYSEEALRPEDMDNATLSAAVDELRDKTRYLAIENEWMLLFLIKNADADAGVLRQQMQRVGERVTEALARGLHRSASASRRPSFAAVITCHH
ncbi:Protein of unknown function [Gryllus bimaculatus]|nr:Protein of unknown function [Gryllus bimaculatus]